MSKFWACAAFALVAASASATSATACSPKDAEAANAALDHLDSWTRIAAMAKTYGHCDDGTIAEGVAEAVARLLVDHWDTLPSLDKLSAREPALRQFVLRHIDTTLDTDDLTAITQLARDKCPQGAAALCRALSIAAGRALK